jgi:hypothetical protein
MLPLGFKELKAEADTVEVTFCMDFQKILANDKTFMSKLIYIDQMICHLCHNVSNHDCRIWAVSWSETPQR